MKSLLFAIMFSTILIPNLLGNRVKFPNGGELVNSKSKVEIVINNESSTAYSIFLWNTKSKIMLKLGTTSSALLELNLQDFDIKHGNDFRIIVKDTNGNEIGKSENCFSLGDYEADIPNNKSLMNNSFAITNKLENNYLYPNPASTSITIELKNKDCYDLDNIVGINGVSMPYSYEIVCQNKFYIHNMNLQNGVYMAVFRSKSNILKQVMFTIMK